MEKRCDIGVIGLAVMGQNLVLNMNDHGYSVAVFNRTLSRVTNFLEGPAQQTSVVGTSSPADLVRSLKSPRKIMLMVRAGEVVDMFINTLWPLLDEGDIIIDGGNSNYRDTVRRVDEMKAHGILYVGAGISGGEEGARRGPSIMPGGNSRAWPEIQQIFQDIAARADDGSPCCDWVGDGGAGHFIKMVHNGIEYGDMQLISEAWHFMRAGLGLDNDRIAAVFDSWNTTELNSYLIEITADILRFREKESGDHLVDKILDSAGQKGTGKWTGISALEHGIPLTLITSAVFARCLSALKEQRVEAARLFARTVTPPAIETAAVDDWIDHLRQSLLAARIISYAQGFMLMREASAAFSWELNYHRIARIWRGGCIIRSSFLDDIANAYTAEPSLPFLGSAPWFHKRLTGSTGSWRRVVAKAVEIGLPMPAMSAALSFLDGYTCDRLPASLLQAQRDYFGAHTYQRIDRPPEEFFHTDWTGHGGKTSSTTYDV